MFHGSFVVSIYSFNSSKMMSSVGMTTNGSLLQMRNAFFLVLLDNFPLIIYSTYTIMRINVSQFSSLCVIFNCFIVILFIAMYLTHMSHCIRIIHLHPFHCPLVIFFL